MKTRERILQTSLALFNEQGEGAVSTNHIADEMDISPGNLYYHFRNKDQIVSELYDRYHHELSSLLDVPADVVLELEDVWLFLHLVLERVNEYRFIYDNLTDILRRLRPVRRQFGFLLKSKREAALALCRALQRSGMMTATQQEIEDLSTNVVMVATFWIGYESASGTPYLPRAGGGAYQVMTLLAPYLREPERSHLGALADAYRH
ncbi:MAG: TetR/AcrR family transcriptional regulator [Pseudomonadota bacterium]